MGPRPSARLTRCRDAAARGLATWPPICAACCSVKKAAALANVRAGALVPALGELIAQACDRLLTHFNPSDFPADPLLGGGQIALNMNVNEVVAAVANDIARQQGIAPHGASQVHPKMHVNLSQSTADVCHTAAHLAVLEAWEGLASALDYTVATAQGKARDFAPTMTLARTCMRDASAVSAGALLEGWARVLARRAAALAHAAAQLEQVNLGGTVVGAGDGACVSYRGEILAQLRQVTGRLTMRPSLVDAAQNADDLGAFMASLGLLATSLIKIAKDLRLLSSGPSGGFAEVLLAPVMEGSSFYPGKVNPVMEETLMQAAFEVLGMERTTMAALEHGELHLNVFEGVAAVKIIQATQMLASVIAVGRSSASRKSAWTWINAPNWPPAPASAASPGVKKGIDMETAQLQLVREWLKTPKAGFVGGRFLAAEGPFVTSENPADQTPVGRFAATSPFDVNAAVTAAHGAFRNGPWPQMTRRARAATLQKLAGLIRQHQAELATLEALDNGKLYSEAYNDDLPETADVFDYYAGWIDKHHSEVNAVEQGQLNYMQREPVGVCALIVPWNFPLLMAAWKLAPALAMGNTVVVKPSPFTSLSLIRLLELVNAADILPAGVLNVVLGGGEQGSLLTRHPQVHKVSFTGSTATGRDILHASADSNLKTVTLELGGKSPNIIFADAPDLDFAVRRSFTAMFSHKGEKCSEPTRLLVERPVYTQVVEQLAEMAGAVVCGDPFAPSSTQGAQCFKEHFERIMGYIQSGKDEGARLVAGGARATDAGCDRGYFVRPTIFADVKRHQKIAREEIFGPVLCVTPFATEAEAVELANDTTYGLAAGFWTKDIGRAHRVARQLDAGQVFVNRYGCYDFASPFGGFKQSGWGKEMGRQSLDAYTKLKSVWVTY